MFIRKECRYLDWGRKLENQEETLKAQGEHANFTHTEEVIFFPKSIKASFSSALQCILIDTPLQILKC